MEANFENQKKNPGSLKIAVFIKIRSGGGGFQDEVFNFVKFLGDFEQV